MEKVFFKSSECQTVTTTRELPPAESDFDIKTGDLDHAKIDKVIKSLNNYKAPGFNYNITVEETKYGLLN